MRYIWSGIVLLLLAWGGTLPVFGGVISGVTVHNFSPGEYRAKRQNWSFVQDNRGLMYAANSGGVLEFDAVEWRLLPLPGGGGAYSLARDPNGRIYVGGEKEIGYLEVDDRGVMQYRSLFAKIPPEYRDFGGRVVQVGFIPGGNVFLFERLLVIFEGEQVTAFTAEDHFYAFIYACGSLYIIDDNRGLLQYQDGKLLDVPGGGLVRAYVMLPYNGDKILLVTTQEGPFIFAPRDKQNPFTPYNTHPTDFFSGNLVSCGLILEDETLVLGSIEKGIAVFDKQGNQVAHITHTGAGEGLQDRHVYGLYRDKDGDLWAGLEQGISLLSSALFLAGKTLNGAAKGTIGTTGAAGTTGTTGTAGTTRPSIPFAAFVRGCRNPNDDSLVFGGGYYNPGDRIQSFKQDQGQVPSFAYAYNGFRFIFGCNRYREIAKIMYSSYLEGLDRGWSDWTGRNEREYTNLGWGEYTLRVRAKDELGEISREAAYIFRIKPPWYETYWFLAGQIVFIMMVLAMSRLLKDTGLAPQMSEKLVIFAVVIIFEYVNGVIGPLIGRYSDGIAFFGMIMTGVMSFIISPAQEFVTNILNKITRVKSS